MERAKKIIEALISDIEYGDITRNRVIERLNDVLDEIINNDD